MNLLGKQEPLLLKKRKLFLNNFQKVLLEKVKRKNLKFSNLETLIENQKIIQNYILGEKKKICMHYCLLKVNKEIQDQLQQIEDENDLVLLSKFNVLINENPSKRTFCIHL